MGEVMTDDLLEVVYVPSYFGHMVCCWWDLLLHEETSLIREHLLYCKLHGNVDN